MSTTAEPEPSARVLQRQPWPFHHCPSCGHDEFEVSCRTGHVVFACQGCCRTWRFVLGYLQELPAQPDPIGVGGPIAAGAVARRASTPVTALPVARQG